MRNSIFAQWPTELKPLEFKKVSGNCWDDDFEDECGLWRHEHAVMAEGPIWLFIRMLELPSDCQGKLKHKWMASLVAASPFFATDSSIISALEFVGDYPEDTWDELTDEQRELALCEALISAGTHCPILDKTSTRAKGPFRGCTVEATGVSSMWGFIADRQVNAIGNSGWDFLAGKIGFGEQYRREPNAFHRKVIDWLNTHYPERKEHHEAQ